MYQTAAHRNVDICADSCDPEGQDGVPAGSTMTKSKSHTRIGGGLRQTVLSGLVFCGILAALVSVDPRVRDRMTELVGGGGDPLASWSSRATQLVDALGTALRHQSIENAPLLVFATVGAVLFLFMVRT